MKLSKHFVVGLAILMLAALIVPVAAQDGPQGGVIIEANPGGDPTTLDPLLSSDATTADLQGFMFPGFVAVDPSNAQYVQEGPGSIVKSYDISDDGLVYTFHLRDDMYWNDGVQITADDSMFVWDALNSGLIDSPLLFYLDQVAGVEKVDDFTIQVTFNEADCDSVANVGFLAPYPSHIAPEDLSTMPDQPYALNPNVTSGPFKFGEFRPGEAITLVADQTYGDAELGYVNPDGFVLLSVPDLTVNVERFLAGELNVIQNPQEALRGDIYAAEEAGEVQVYKYAGDTWDYLAFNLADPENPQDGMDADGNLIDQGMHPLFGNTEVGKDVRRALNLALDVNDVIERSTFGEATRMTSHLVPGSWAYATDLPFVPYDPELAAQMLDEAGWPNSDPADPTSVRVCQGCGTTEDGTEFRFDMMTNEENARRTAIITIAQENWSKIGVKAEIQTIEFYTMLDIIDAETWDAYVLGWRAGYPDRPDATQILTPAGDVVGGGSNQGSYASPEFIRLNEEARLVPGCDINERIALYQQAQAVIQEDTPYIFLFARDGMYAAQAEVEGFAPYPARIYWNIDTWSVRTVD